MRLIVSLGFVNNLLAKKCHVYVQSLLYDAKVPWNLTIIKYIKTITIVISILSGLKLSKRVYQIHGVV